MRLKNKTALITGGNSGIGLATARLFISEGAQVAITGRNQKTLDAAETELGSRALAIQADVTDPGAIERAVAVVADKFGKIDVLFANAGIGKVTPLGQTSLAGFEEILRTNLTSVFFTVQAAAPYLNDGGSIIFNGSVLAVMGMPGWSAYGATKAGVRAMTRILASELAPRRIRVNQVTPGGTRTPIWAPFAPSKEAQTALENRISRAVPLRRMGETADIANAVLYLASDESSYVTGQELVVDGGATGSPQGAPIYQTAA